MMTRNTLHVTVPGFAFAVLWEKLDLGALPRALFVPSPGATTTERARFEHNAAQELSRIGVGAGAPVDQELVAALRLLAMPTIEYYGWIVPADGPVFSVLASASGQHAVLARLKDGFVDMVPIHAGQLALTVAGELPLVPPAAEQVVLAEYTLPAFETATRTKVTGNGQLHAAHRDRLGLRRQHQQAIEYVDTPRGRWLLRRDGAGGMPSALPGVAEGIAAELGNAARQLVASARTPPRTGRAIPRARNGF